MPFMYKNLHSHATTDSPPSNPHPPLDHHELLHHHHHHLPNDNNNNNHPFMFSPPYRLMLATSTWLRTRRSRCLFLLLFSPILLPLLCATFPLLCAAEICIRLCRRGRRKQEALFEDDSDRLRRCEEGFRDCDCDCEKKEVGLLQRYLEDQLLLVGSVYECGDEFDDHRGQDRQNDLDRNTPLLR